MTSHPTLLPGRRGRGTPVKRPGGASRSGTLSAMDANPAEEYAQIDTSGPLFDEVNEALQLIRPAIQSDGGDVGLVEIEDESIAIIELFGKCVGCPMSEITVRHGIEAHLRNAVPRIMGVDVVADRSVPVRDFKSVIESVTFKPLV